MSEQTANLCTTDACESLRQRLAKYEDAEGRPVGLTHDQAELVGLVRDLALRAGKHARPLIHAAALGLESQAREIERLKAWKSEEMEVMTPLLDYARSVCAGPLGCSITEWLVSDHKRLAALETQPSGVDERAAFEAHMISEGYMSNQFKRAEDDKYENPYLQDYYELWTARAALSAPSHGEQVREVPSIQVCKLGRLGAAYDPADTRYAYTYTEQPDNVGAMKLGRAAAINATGKHGDEIDRGLHLLLQLQAEGFGVFQLAAPSAGSQEKG